VISGDYFAAMGIPLKAGRLFNSDEQREVRRTIVITESMAQQAFPGVDPIGRRVAVSWADDEYDEVVGVVGDIHHAGLDEAPRPMIYWPHIRTPYTRMFPVVRTTGDPAAIIAAAREEVKRLDAAQPIASVRTLEELVSNSIAQPRLIMRLLAVFAAVALTLAAVGIYGVVAYGVSQRTREIGIRMALGATPRGVTRLVAGQGAILAGAGIAIGVPAALLLARGMASMLFDTDPADPATIGAVALVLATAALTACLVPLRKALKVDPARALRSE
jgi:putative ABC transport system permease protein